LFTRQEFLVALGLLIAAAEFSHNGKDLFKRGDQKKSIATIKKIGTHWYLIPALTII
jgi:hypothetical protein